MTFDLEKIKIEFGSALQETDPSRPLDSLETVVIKTIASKHGIQIADEIIPETNSIAGWIAWIERFSKRP